MPIFEPSWVRADDTRYESLRRNYNEMHQARPAAIALVRTVDDVRTALSRARSDGLRIAVRGGGHSIAGFGSVQAGLVVDLRAMSEIAPASAAGQFWIGGGALAGHVATTLGQRGLVLPLGDSAGVGIGGITLGGGIGWLTRKFGLTLDCLTGAEIVTADGAISTVDEVKDPELFWALRGGGGNFGVVTRLRFRPHALGEVLGGSMLLPLSAEVLEMFLALAASAPDELGVIALAMRPPNEANAEPTLVLRLVWSGDPAGGAHMLTQLRGLASPMSEEIQWRSYADMYKLTENDPASITNATETLFADELNSDGVRTIVRAASALVEDAFSGIEIRVLGGAMARVPPSTTAFAHRARKLLISAVRAGFPVERYPDHRRWVSGVRHDLSSFETGRYLNFIEAPDVADSISVYPGRIAARLAAVKRAVDPDNLFSHNLPITAGTPS